MRMDVSMGSEMCDRFTYGHVRLAADVCLCERLFELAGDAEVAELDLALLVDEHVRGLDVCASGSQQCV